MCLASLPFHPKPELPIEGKTFCTWKPLVINWLISITYLFRPIPEYVSYWYPWELDSFRLGRVFCVMQIKVDNHKKKWPNFIMHILDCGLFDACHQSQCVSVSMYTLKILQRFVYFTSLPLVLTGIILFLCATRLLSCEPKVYHQTARRLYL